MLVCTSTYGVGQNEKIGRSLMQFVWDCPHSFDICTALFGTCAQAESVKAVEEFESDQLNLKLLEMAELFFSFLKVQYVRFSRINW